MSDRTPEQREAARLERERRRAARAGEPLPPPAPSADDRRFQGAERPENVGHPELPAHDPQPTQMFDVTAAWTEEHAAVAAPPEPESEPAPVVPPPSEHEAEVPLGTRRVARHERPGRAKPPRPPRLGRGARPVGGAPADGPRWGRRIAALLAILAIAVAGWFLWSIYQPGKGGGSGSVVVTIPRGAGVSQIGDLLASKGVIDSSFFFKLRAKLSGAGGDIKSGTFMLREGMSYGAALDALTHEPPPPPTIRITIPEGRSRYEIAQLAGRLGLRGSYLVNSRSAPGFDLRRLGAPRDATLEGFLFPATYELRRGASTRQLVTQQLRAFDTDFGQVNLRYARSKNLTVYDVVTIASMVEREVAVPRERPLVAAVIYNRLKAGMPLGIDATLRFALNDWTRPLTVSQLANPTPYNTRTHQGLPPGPIGNPGLASLQAAAHPAHVPYLFYVVKPGTCGQHAFSSTDAQFQRDVQRYDSARAAAGGKSPEKC